VVHPSVPAKTVPEFIAYAKANPGRINMGSAGNGTPGHMSGELFKMMTRLDLVHVPYRGGAPALTDLLAGQVQVMFDNLPTSIEHIRAGRLQALAVTTSARSQMLPELPTVSEFVPGYEVSSWFGIGAPRTTPANIIEKLNAEVGVALADPGLQSRIAELSSTPLPLSPQELATLAATETEKWAKVVTFSGANAALRDFDPAYDRNGSPSFDQPRRPETLRTAGTIPR
jgi:tripartite-type tricarboxylate transporter receptor subunit TctC